MQPPPIVTRIATATDRPAVMATLAAAFTADPVMRHIFPDDARRPARLLRFFDLVTSAEAPGNTIVAGDLAAVAIWRAPGEWRTAPSAMLRLALPMLRTFGTALPRALRVQSVLEAHHPESPRHWYLEFAGCGPAHQGRGYGGAAIRAKLAACDRDRLPAMLETANETNCAIYAALGFAVTGTFDAAPGLRFWSMWREPAI